LLELIDEVPLLWQHVRAGEVNVVVWSGSHVHQQSLGSAGPESLDEPQHLGRHDEGR
jgi:hypothetical protein